MKESLDLLKITESGIKVSEGGMSSLSDSNLLEKAKSIQSVDEREKILKQVLDSNPSGFPKSKLYLAEILAEKDPKYSCKLVFSSNYYSPDNAENYIIYAKIAIKNNAWKVALSSLDAALWLDNKKENEAELEKLYLAVNKNIENKLKDDSDSELWVNKFIDKYWVLEKFYYQADYEKLVEYSFRLINSLRFDYKNYETAVKALSLLEDKNQIVKYSGCILKNLPAESFEQYLYLGISSFYLSNYDDVIQKLESALKIEPKNHTVLYYLATSYLISNKLEEYVRLLQVILLEKNNIFAPLYFIYTAIFNISVGKEEFPNQQVVSRDVANLINKLMRNNKQALSVFLIEKFSRLDYYSALPYLKLYLSEMFINLNYLDLAEKILNGSSDIEVHRIKAWILRLRGRFNDAEMELSIYRKTYTPTRFVGFNCHAVNLNFPANKPSNEADLLNIVKNTYEQVRELISKINLEYGLDPMTCIEAKCQDCCTKTFPYLTYTEYIYLRKWLEEQGKELVETVQNNSKNVLDVFRKKYNKEAEFIFGEVSDVHDYYPKEFVFDCPNLGDNKCNVYEARPLMCRVFGYGSMDKIKYRGCDYFMEQFKSATKLTNFRKVINMSSFYKYAISADKNLIGMQVVAPIPRWFAQGHEETMNILKKQFDKNKKDD